MTRSDPHQFRVGTGGVTSPPRQLSWVLPTRCQTGATQGSPPTSSEDDEVRATMKQIREALEASGAEIERSKRLLSETEDLLDLPASSEPEGSDE